MHIHSVIKCVGKINHWPLQMVSKTKYYVHFAFRVGHNEVIGVCRAGPDAEGLGRDHWNEMLAYPRKPITHWHALCEVRN